VGEFDLIAQIQSRLSLPPAQASNAGVLLGIGDDAALLSVTAGHTLVACTDTLVSGIHFPADTDLEHVAYKAVAVNISDLAAMGAAPRWILLSLVMPASGVGGIERLVDGLTDACEEYGLGLVGGDTCRGETLVLTVQALGELEPGVAMRRSGSVAGDRLLVSGSIGDAALALFQQRSGDPDPALTARLERPTARVSLGRGMRAIASACIDISDGLVADAAHLARSSGVAVMIDADRIPLSDAFRAQCPAAQRDELSLAGGDDYELLFGVAPGQVSKALSLAASLGVPLTEIGHVEAGSGVTVTRQGESLERGFGGFDHFR
jgi:thiamine-monophosphate kinase